MPGFNPQSGLLSILSCPTCGRSFVPRAVASTSCLEGLRRQSQIESATCLPTWTQRGMDQVPPPFRVGAMPLHHMPTWGCRGRPRPGNLETTTFQRSRAQIKRKRQRGDANPCGQSPMDSQSITLAIRSRSPWKVIAPRTLDTIGPELER